MLSQHSLGENVSTDNIRVGQRYAVLSLGGCVSCIAKAKGIPPSEDPAQEFLSLPFFGLGENGGHAEYAVVDEQFLVPVVSRQTFLGVGFYSNARICHPAGERSP